MSRSSRTLAMATMAVMAAVLVLPPAAWAQGAEATLRTITASGSGEVRAAPDQAQLSAGVVSEAKTAEAALGDNSRKMNAVFAALERQGVPKRAIQTSGFSVSPQYPNYNSNQPHTITGYQVSNTVTVSLDQTGKLGPVLDALVQAGANQVNSVSYAIADPRPLLKKARSEAVKAASEEAQTYAAAAGVTLGPVQSINEGGGNEGPRPMATRLKASAAPPMAEGEQTVSANVTITWTIQ